LAGESVEAKEKTSIPVPKAVARQLGGDPERETLEALLLHLIRQEKITVGRAGEILGLDKMAAIRWYTSHGFHYPDITPDEFDEQLRYAEGLQ
jgi:hypothetical protein